MVYINLNSELMTSQPNLPKSSVIHRKRFSRVFNLYWIICIDYLNQIIRCEIQFWLNIDWYLQYRMIDRSNIDDTAGFMQWVIKTLQRSEWICYKILYPCCYYFSPLCYFTQLKYVLRAAVLCAVLQSRAWGVRAGTERRVRAVCVSSWGWRHPDGGAEGGSSRSGQPHSRRPCRHHVAQDAAGIRGTFARFY